MIFLGPIAVQEVTNGMTQIASLEEVFKEFGLEMADLVLHGTTAQGFGIG
jgi:hypothetical protein